MIWLEVIAFFLLLVVFATFPVAAAYAAALTAYNATWGLGETTQVFAASMVSAAIGAACSVWFMHGWTAGA